ncbi:cytochrome c1 [Aestuariispira insulae]|uniref:Cytochrome c1 n=1 Tax=Aestuariispira insulae TaxID=1461337 RepID=A0A3D9HH94_9PROT|nr:cytochrome c1 [Aestuariispira insulae]RED48631.1 ubiquinol-cytochrome c reductase cytochrome c1 subunit [Aestuariispira insulae]
MRKSVFALAAALMMGATGAQAAGDKIVPAEQEWSWTGYFGKFDKASAQRGLQVYQEVCSTCHGLKRVAYRNLMDLGYTEDQVKAFAAEYEVMDGPDDEGEMFFRAAIPADKFVSPFANDNAARASNGGALPPDLSLIVKARATGYGSIPLNFAKWMQGNGTASGADYIYALLTGYEEDDETANAWLKERWDHAEETGHLTKHQLEEGFKEHVTAEGKYFNRYFPGHNIGMAPPIDDDYVEYEDGTEATKEQIARDIATFLAWASEPELEQRKEMGWKVILFLVFLLGLTIAAKRRLWKNVKK